MEQKLMGAEELVRKSAIPPVVARSKTTGQSKDSATRSFADLLEDAEAVTDLIELRHPSARAYLPAEHSVTKGVVQGAMGFIHRQVPWMSLQWLERKARHEADRKK